MCGRIWVKPTPTLEQLLEAFEVFDLVLPILNNAAPTEQLPFLYPGEDGRFQASMMRWSLHPGGLPTPPPWSYATHNSRIEDTATSRAFGAPLRYRRGIALMAGFVEWQTEVKIIETGITKAGKIKTKTIKNKLPYYADCIDQPMIAAGIWDVWRDQVCSFAIITQPANEAFAPYHSRMPLSLTREQAREWMASTDDAPGLLKALEGSSLPLRIRAVSPEINDAKKKIDVSFVERELNITSTQSSLF
ncbi:SOS response-associated peptidase [Cellvibrio zantedeschiae]|nr:SOS response-associated peptidase family protein [Cellvibrio zantedeschiae]